jgi:hypothetical protein
MPLILKLNSSEVFRIKLKWRLKEHQTIAKLTKKRCRL